MGHGLQHIYRGLRYGKPLVVVSGLPRSGTSMAMMMLEAGGLRVVSDGVRLADDDNPKGYLEHERVKDLGQAADRSWLRSARGQCIKIISYLLKDLPADNNYRVLFMRRDYQEILASQAKMLDRRGERSDTDDERMIELYENHLWRVKYMFKHTAHFDVYETEYKQVLEAPLEAARQINHFLGGELDVGKMAGVVDERLYRNRCEPDR